MNKVILGIVALGSLYCNVLNAGTMGPVGNAYEWSGWYLGANAGYWWSQHTVTTIGTPGYINPLFPSGSSNISNALAALGTNRIANHAKGFIGGAQVGYNREVNARWVLGVDADIEGLTQSHAPSATQVVPVGSFPEQYTSTVTVKKGINWLGALRAKLGLLLQPSILVYGTGGLAYGGVSLNEFFVASESLGAASYPTVIAQNNSNKTRAGWTAGAGIEWLFKHQWSAKIEYAYYGLGTLNGNTVLNQINNLGVTPTLWGSAYVSASRQLAANTVRIGVNYHFA